ncbi:trimethylamine-N-oxide reductase [Salmonella bongori]|nr:trimethylamine-N-oxide reductase [Salmonella bongori]
MKNKDTLYVSRRRFLAQLGGLTVAGMLGPSLLTPPQRSCGGCRDAWRRDERRYPDGSHWGAIRATVAEGRFVAAKPFEQDKYPSKMNRRPARSCSQCGAYPLPDGACRLDAQRSSKRHLAAWG